MKKSFHLSQAQRGVGMVEVMVAMLLLGVAVVGFAALQVRALSVTGNSSERTQAMGIAQELGEKIRANMTQVATYQNSASWVTAVTPSCLTANCTAAQMATWDIQTTLTQVTGLLPNGKVVARQCNGSNNLCIYVAWNQTTVAVDGSTNSCVNTAGGYSSLNADCVVMEIY